MLTMLKVYAGRNCVEELAGFKFDLTAAGDLRNYRLRWLATLILSHVLCTQNESGAMQGHPNLIEVMHLTDATNKYVRQLLQASDWQGALTVALLMPQSHEMLMRRLVFEILTKQAASIEHSQAFLNQIGLPIQWIQAALALFYQSGG